MAIDLTADGRIFQHFVANVDGEPADYTTARTQAGQAALALLRDAASGDYTLGDLLTALYQAQEVIGDASRHWVKSMLDFVKSFKPDFEIAKNRFAPSGENGDVEVRYDDTLKICMVYVDFLVQNAATGLVPGLTVNKLFDPEKLQKLRELHGRSDTQQAIQKLKSGSRLNFDERRALHELFSMAPDVMSLLSSTFSDLGGNRGSPSSVLLSEESLTALATRSTNKQTRLIDAIIEQVRNLADPSRFVR
jgi:hypothetical protein